MLKQNCIKIIAPLLALSFLFSCNNTNYKVNEQEYKEALSFSGVKYTQFKQVENEAGSTDYQQIMKLDFSPIVFRTQSSYKYEKETYIVSEEVVNKVKDGDSWKYWYYWKDYIEHKEPKWERRETTSDHFSVPSVVLAGMFGTFLYDYKFSDFKFNSQNNTYDNTSTQDECIINMELKFANKKITSLKVLYKMEGKTIGGTTLTCSYKKITPEVPDIK